MTDISLKIREIAARLLESGQVDMFIGWEEGEEQYQTRPFIAHRVEDVEKLVFNQYAVHNLANALLKYRDGSEKIGMLAKGCDSRGIVRLLQDGQFQRERLYIVGIACPGMKDPLAAAKSRSGFLPAVTDSGLAAKCTDCIEPNPVIYDELIGEKETPRVQEGQRFKLVQDIENMTLEERYRFFEDIFSRCIRCYACRQACVACNCRTCIFDEMKPQWVGRETSISDNFMYHLVRASHMAGRCIECGECERVCPVNIPLMLINQKLIKDVNAFFGPYEAGMAYTEGAKPPLSSYQENDPDNFL